MAELNFFYTFFITLFHTPLPLSFILFTTLSICGHGKALSSGEHNAGEVRLVDENTIDKVNNFVFRKYMNTVARRAYPSFAALLPRWRLPFTWPQIESVVESIKESGNGV